MLSNIKYKNITRIHLPEVDLSLHEDNPQVNEMTVQGFFPCLPSFPLTFYAHKFGRMEVSTKDVFMVT